MGNYSIIQRPAIMVVGITCRTSNAPEAGPVDIPRLWERFYKEVISNQIPNKLSNEVIALYCDYEGDHTKPYSMIIGCPVSSLESIPEGLVGKVIPTGSYAKFSAKGEHPNSLIETWGQIWQQELKRTYTGDYELYGEKFFSGSPTEVEVFIAVASEKTKKIVVEPYNPEWPKAFEREAIKIKEALGSNCIAVHHIGSTSIPGLLAKPVIDMIGVVRSAEKSIQPLERLGFAYKGEYNIPMRSFFNRGEGVDINLHLYEEGHPEIELNLLFRDYLRRDSKAREEYAALKEALLKEKSSYEKNNSPFTGYNLGKDAFIRKILKAANFDRVRIVKCTHNAEWDFAKRVRQKYFFDPLSITDPYSDPYSWTFDHKDHAHLILYQGVEMVGYGHIQFWPEGRAALRILVIDERFRNQGFGSHFLQLCEQWLKKQGVRTLHEEARADALPFYRKNGYSEMPFNDPSGEPPSSHDVAVGKRL